ncbi:hypothetical protein BDE02_05G006700 [Populus trichocarpa]|nr:hypothetical protein BDE02_05G006700 [Populus trichocarpa]KAI5587069.1 hypothetical protein BDE02_05G006700 [Populus trichocarpa]
MGEIRSPYFSLGQYYLGDNPDIHSPYFSYGGEDYHRDNAEIHPPYSSAGDYHGDNAEIHQTYYSAGDYAEIHPPYSSAGDYFRDNAEIHSPYSSAADYLADNTEIHSEALFHQDIYGNSYNAQQFVKHEKVLRPVSVALKYEQESDVCIYRVGDHQSKKAMYSPQQISIGPFHHGNRNLRFMERKKYEYYEQFWEDRVSKERERKGAEDEFWDALEEDKNKIHQCYEDGSRRIKISQRFLGLILCDAVFIFELFLKYREGREKYIKDSILKETWLRAAIRRDLILLENQLPFFILEKLYKLLPENIKRENTEFKTLACFYFERHFPKKSSSAETTPLHFTDLVRSLLSFTGNGKPVEQIKSFHSATRLRQAGVKFKVPRELDHCLLDVDFRRLRKEFHIPQLQIHGDTESLFRNLMALEKHLYPGQEYICHYINLLSILVVKPKDAKLLMENKIVTYCKDEVAVRDLICSLASSSTTDLHSCYHDIFSAVDDYYKSSWAKNPAYFIEEFFGNFWKGVGTVCAAILLILTLVQTICAILGLR